MLKVLFLTLLFPVSGNAGSLERATKALLIGISNYEQPKIAVIQFEPLAGTNPKDAQIINDRAIVLLTKEKRITLVERSRLEGILSELRLKASGVTERDAEKIGHILDADFVLTGVVVGLDSERVEANMRIAEVATGKILSAEKVEIKRDWRTAEKEADKVKSLEMGRIQKEIDEYTVLIAHGGNVTNLALNYYLRGLAYCREIISDFNSATVDLQKAISFGDKLPTLPSAYLFLGHAHYKSGRYIEAISAFDMAIKQYAPTEALEGGMTELLESCLWGKRYSDLVIYANKGFSLYPQNRALYYHFRGLGNFHLGIYPEAQSDLEKATPLTAFGTEERNSALGWINFEAKEYQAAASHFLKAKLCADTYAGLAYFKLGNYIEAERNYRKATLLESGFNTELESIGNYYFYTEFQLATIKELHKRMAAS